MFIHQYTAAIHRPLCHESDEALMTALTLALTPDHRHPASQCESSVRVPQGARASRPLLKCARDARAPLGRYVGNRQRLIAVRLCCEGAADFGGEVVAGERLVDEID